ncbi:hypothetical protein LJC24_05285 [Desulfococcaceae bacterium OttesenSCG-928-F15]|nr:hypothetical protein [Desulfococcaceae bacterium OttesenSCG-928-F15]
MGRTAKSFFLELDVEECDVAGIFVRYAEDAEEAYRSTLKCARWEVVLPRMVGRPLGMNSASIVDKKKI